MSINNNQGNKLFLVCPFCQMENFIMKHYGDVFFLTAPAAIFHFDGDGLQATKEFLKREHINEIYLVADTSCNFINSVLNGKASSGLKVESEIQELKSDDDTLHSLTEKLLKSQTDRLRSNDLFGEEIEEGKVSLHTISTDKQDNKITQIS